MLSFIIRNKKYLEKKLYHCIGRGKLTVIMEFQVGIVLGWNFKLKKKRREGKHYMKKKRKKNAKKNSVLKK